MKSPLQKGFAIFFSIWLPLAGLVWTVEKHYCMGRTMDVSFFHPAEKCGMDMDLGFETKQKSKPSCCSDDGFSLQGIDDLLVLDQDDIEHLDLVFIGVGTYPIEWDSSLGSSETPISQYPRPPDFKHKDRSVLAVYLI